MPVLPHCDDLFLKFFDRWYDPADRKRKGFPATRPDLLQSDDLKGRPAEQACRLTKEAQREVAHRIETMVECARKDWPQYLYVFGEPDLKWIEAWDEHHDEERIARLIKTSNPSDFSNDYVVLCCEFGAVLGQVMRDLLPRLVWHLEWPYWESALLDPRTGNLMPVFHWAIKKMSDYGWDDGFAEKVEACVALLEQS